VNIDKSIHQIVLMIHEPPRNFETPVPSGTIQEYKKRCGSKWFESLRADSQKIGGVSSQNMIRYKGDKVVVRRKTPGTKRHYLMGVDERQLFICQLPKGVSTVRDAHSSLKAPTVTLAEGKVPGRTIRQGEWFFVNISDEEMARVNSEVKKMGAHKKASIGRFAGRSGGKPHVADELVTVTGEALEHGFPVRQRPEVYVRGSVHHPDHKTVRFSSWRKVIANTESNSGRMEGVNWVD
jgi:hypothetical protein